MVLASFNPSSDQTPLIAFTSPKEEVITLASNCNNPIVLVIISHQKRRKKFSFPAPDSSIEAQAQGPTLAFGTGQYIPNSLLLSSCIFFIVLHKQAIGSLSLAMKETEGFPPIAASLIS